MITDSRLSELMTRMRQLLATLDTFALAVLAC
jgi:hypothetical protein